MWWKTLLILVISLSTCCGAITTSSSENECTSTTGVCNQSSECIKAKLLLFFVRYKVGDALQPEMTVDQDSEYPSGFFLSEDPIPFDGTVVHVTASGYCALGMDQPALILVVAQPNATNRFENVLAVCDKTSTSTSNVTVGRVDEAVRIAVSAGDYLGIPFNSECVSKPFKICTFWPATNSESKGFFYLNNSITNNEFSLPKLSSIATMPTIGLYFSFIIESGESVYKNVSTRNIIGKPCFAQKSAEGLKTDRSLYKFCYQFSSPQPYYYFSSSWRGCCTNTTEKERKISWDSDSPFHLFQMEMRFDF